MNTNGQLISGGMDARAPQHFLKNILNKNDKLLQSSRSCVNTQHSSHGSGRHEDKHFLHLLHPCMLCNKLHWESSDVTLFYVIGSYRSL